MSFSARESSRTKGAPFSLYFFRYGDEDTSYHAYTNAEQPVEFTFDVELGPVTFLPIAITRGKIVASGVLDKAPLPVRMPQDAALADLFMLYPPSRVVTLKIWDGHVDESELHLAWSGRVLSHASEPNEAVFTCEPISTAMKRAGLTRNYQHQCPLTLYSQGWGQCNANQEAATTSTVVLSVDGPLVSLPSNWAPADKKASYANGFVVWTRTDGRVERRTILKINSGDVMVLSGQALGLEAGMALSVTLGCPHDMTGCAELHNNIQNYGGQPFIPTSNPFGIKNGFY